MAPPFTTVLLALASFGIGYQSALASVSEVPEDCFLCGTPPLNNEQLASIDPARVQAIRDLIVQNGNHPILENDVRFSPEMSRPLVTPTQAQMMSLNSIYGDNATGTPDVLGTRKKRNGGSGGETCTPQTQNLVVFTISQTGATLQCSQTGVMSPSTCNHNGGCTGNTGVHCCVLELICVPVLCVNVDQSGPPAWDLTNIMINRCTCTNC